MNSRSHEDIPWFASNEYRRQSMFVPCLNDAPVVIGGIGKGRRIEIMKSMG